MANIKDDRAYLFINKKHLKRVFRGEILSTPPSFVCKLDHHDWHNGSEQALVANSHPDGSFTWKMENGFITLDSSGNLDLIPDLSLVGATNPTDIYRYWLVRDEGNGFGYSEHLQ